MTISVPTMCIITDAKKTDINHVWEAMGRGPGTFSVRLAAPPTDTASVATHWLMCDMSAKDTDAAVWGRMAAAFDLPPLPDGVLWGQNGVIPSAAAQAAMVDLRVFTAYGLAEDDDGFERQAWLAGILEGQTLALIPDDIWA